jgi:hypothetical protein
MLMYIHRRVARFITGSWIEQKPVSDKRVRLDHLSIDSFLLASVLALACIRILHLHLHLTSHRKLDPVCHIHSVSVPSNQCFHSFLSCYFVPEFRLIHMRTCRPTKYNYELIIYPLAGLLVWSSGAP